MGGQIENHAGIISKIRAFSNTAGETLPERLLEPFSCNSYVVGWALQYGHGGGEYTNLVLEAVALHWGGRSLVDGVKTVDILNKVRAHFGVCVSSPRYAPLQATYLWLSRLAFRVAADDYQHVPDRFWRREK